MLAGMKTITIKIPDGVFEWLSSNARRRKQTAAELARATLTAAAQANGGTFGELMADLAGIGEGKHSDLSTNKKHLDDFGR